MPGRGYGLGLGLPTLTTRLRTFHQDISIQYVFPADYSLPVYVEREHAVLLPGGVEEYRLLNCRPITSSPKK